MHLITRFTVNVSYKLIDSDDIYKQQFTKGKPYLVLGCHDGYLLIADDTRQLQWLAIENAKIVAHDSLGGVPCNA